ncbi:hypothetical protein PIB30_044714 [Stylosanthes scabra]|uniref:Uncharacterized protein n=1 Tax=Stylosanthes scabra TaxID=79078 RepID=A0ABU6UH97_9FABA|nr:hypothetical protein [Stylosanthes scabra]
MEWPKVQDEVSNSRWGFIGVHLSCLQQERIVQFEKLSSIIQQLQERSTQSNSKREIEELLGQLKLLREEGNNGGLEIVGIERRLESAYVREEQYWKEKSRMKWLQGGDKNTKLFHQSFQSRMCHNKI